jgi:PPOX class probable F420-dependent enzyme
MRGSLALVEDALARLAAEEIVWLTTVRTDGQPQSSPVWFVWHDGALYVASEPGSAKVANIRRHPPVAVHLEGAGPGELVVSIEGTATVADGLPDDVALAYRRKYEAGVARLGMTGPGYLERFAAGIAVVPRRWRVFPSD